MNDSQAGIKALTLTIQPTQRCRVAFLAAAGASLPLVTMLGGCSLVQPGVSLNEMHAAELRSAPATQPAVATTPGPKADAPVAGVAEALNPSPADVMFQSTDAPVQARGNTVNVFGEVGGRGPAPFAVTDSPMGLTQQTFLDEGYDADPSVSRDGKWLVFSSTRHSEHPDIYLQRTDGLAVIQLTEDENDDAYPRFSRDGKQITFSSNRAGNWDIYTMDVDGTHVRQLTHSPAQEIHSSFSPDGGKIVFSSLSARSGQWELWTVDLHTDERRMIGYGLFPDWSPRGDKDVIAFQRARQRGTRWFSAWTLDLVDGEARDVSEIAYSGTNAIVAPTWSADGTRLAFCTIADPDAGAEPKKGEHRKTPRQDIWTINADGTDRMKLTDGHSLNAMPAWARDGRIYFVSDRAGIESIWSAATPSPRSLAASAPLPVEEPPVMTAMGPTALVRESPAQRADPGTETTPERPVAETPTPETPVADVPIPETPTPKQAAAKEQEPPAGHGENAAAHAE